MKLNYYKNSKGEKVYTLREEINGEKTHSAHYKFIKLKNAPEYSQTDKKIRRD